ncbi:MAG: hypothetical protein SFZ02_17630 [bacterium]|nr:hypothetical protein [bacterium]
MVTLIQVSIYGLVLWLGCYLISRDLSSWRLRFAGLALISYGVNVGLMAFNLSDSLAYLRLFLIWLPPIFWLGAVIESMPEDKRIGQRLQWMIRYGLISLAIGLVILSITIDSLILPLLSGLIDGAVVWIIVLCALMAMLFTTLPIYLTIAYAPINSPKRLNYLMILFSFFLAGSYFLLILSPILNNILILWISADLLMLGTIIAVWDAMDAGESLVPDMLRSFTSSFLMVVIVVGQVLLIMPDASDTKFLLILMLITTVIVVVTFEIPIQNRLDRVIFSRFPAIRQQRKDLRMAEAITIRRVEHPILTDEAEFIRYTRRAISSYGDLTKLATSPLTHLPIIQQRLAQRNAHDDTLERAKELKALLTESIMRLKPNGADFGTSDEWRYFNALYFPYVVGLKPYSLRVFVDDLDGAYRDALTWFRSQVPERTLYNWQNAAAMLIAQDLRERK